MARPKDKNELISAVCTNFDALWEAIGSLTDEEFSTEFDFSSNLNLKETHWLRDKNVRDLLIHLHEWHKLFLNWVNNNQSGKNVSFLPKPYNWKTYPAMNVQFWENHQSTPYESSVVLLKESYAEVMNIINEFTDEELFTKKYFPWTGTTNLGTYCISATSSHYSWAIKKIRQHKKQLKQ